jgi:hypothetical protein
MGCDIHGWTEKRVGDKWVAYRPIKDRDRDYRLFAALAGVRGDGPDPRGLPPDVSDTAKLDADEWSADGHSHSWLPLPEAFELFKRFAEKEHYSPFTAFDLDEEPDELEEYRLVFWFDN